MQDSSKRKDRWAVLFTPVVVAVVAIETLASLDLADPKFDKQKLEELGRGTPGRQLNGADVEEADEHCAVKNDLKLNLSLLAVVCSFSLASAVSFASGGRFRTNLQSVCDSNLANARVDPRP